MEYNMPQYNLDNGPAAAPPEPPAQPPQKTAKKAFSRVGFALVVMVVAHLAASTLIALLFSALALEGDWLYWVANFAPLYLIAMPLGFLVLRGLPAQTPENSRLGVKSFLLFALMGFPLTYFGNLIGTLLSLLLSMGSSENALVGLTMDTSPLRLLVFVVLAPLTEELFFRKLLIDRAARYGEWCAVVLSALTFALFHMNLYQMFYAFALGLLYGYVYLRTGRIWYTVALHMLVNFLGSVAAPFFLSLADLEALLSAESAPAAQELAALLLQLVPLLLYSLLNLGLSMAGLVVLIVFLVKRKFALSSDGLLQVSRGAQLRVMCLNAGMVIFILLCLVMTGVSLFTV